MQTWEIVMIVTAILVAAVVGWLVYDQQRSKRLRKRFGPEYGRAVSEIGDRRRAESELARREAKLQKLNIRALTSTDRERFLTKWKMTQAVFVDDPVRAVHEADQLVNDVMRIRGYSVDDASERLENISAAYPRIAHSYREACDILSDQASGDASTESLRRAMVNYRELFDEVLGEQREEFKRVS
jgi:hypothetical protein